MKKQIAVSFENETVRLVYAQTGRSGIFVEKALAFTPEEFDRFLATTKDDEFIVVQNFQNFHQDVISLPPAKESFMRQLVELEIKKRVPELKEFFFFYVPLREIQREGRKSREIFFFAVEKAEIEEVLDRFTAHDKVVSRLFPNVLPLSRFIRAADVEPEEPLLGVLDVGSSKTIFLARQGRLYFVRVARSDGKGMHQVDVDNINMTIAYCRQTLRMGPSHVVVAGVPTTADSEQVVAPIVPFTPAKYPSMVMAFDDTSNEYVVPLSAIMYGKELAGSSLLPNVYRDVIVQRKVMTYSILLLALLFFLGLTYIGFQSVEILRSRSAMSDLRRDIDKRRAIIGEFEGTLAGLQKFVPSIEIMNTFSSAADMQKVLESMEAFIVDGIDVHTIGLEDEGGSVRIHVQGSVSAVSYEDLQKRYENFLAEITKTGKMEVESHKLDLQQRGFVIDLKWKA